MVTVSFPVYRLGLFALLSTADFVLTRHLLSNETGAVYEGNPVAGWWLAHYGWMGLATFKIATVACFVLLGVVIFLHRPATGRRVLGFGCLTLAGVVLYSGYLVGQLYRHPEGVESDEKELLTAASTLDQEFDRGMAYRKELSRVTDDLVAHRCTLAEATAKLETSERGREAKWRQTLRVVYRTENDSACFAASIVNNALQMYLRSSDNSDNAGRLLSEYRSAYGHDLPEAGIPRLSAN